MMSPDLSFIGILATVIGLVGWMVKLSAKRSEAITDRFLRHLEDQNNSNQQHRVEFLAAIREHAAAMSEMASQQKEVASKLSEVVVQVKELAEEVTHLKARQGTDRT